jgi:uncharacterized membrane protein YqgA involved in biofilm formation
MNTLDQIAAVIFFCIVGYFVAWFAVAEWLVEREMGQNNGIKHYRAY